MVAVPGFSVGGTALARVLRFGGMFPEPRIIKLDGRMLTVEDTGAASGYPVLMHRGGGSRHLYPALVREARASGFRLIGYDRPGYGGSTRVPGRTLADCAADVSAILTDLALDQVAVWGFSGAGPYALATAALLPGAVSAVCVFAPLGPYGVEGLDFLDGMDESYREEVRLFFQDRQAAREKFRTEAMEMYDRVSVADWWLRQWGDRAHRDETHSQEAADYLAAEHRDGWINGDVGWWDDWSAFLSPWGFDLADVRAPVSLWHGLADTRCPPAHSRWLAGQLTHVVARYPEHDDHTNIEDNNRREALAWLRGRVT